MNPTLRTRNRILATALLGLLAAVAWTAPPAVAADSPAAADFTGRWQGTLTVGDEALRLVFHIDRAEDGTFEAAIDSLDQGATGIPVAEVTVDGPSIHLDVRAINAEYEGRLDDDRKKLQGDWRQSGLTLPLEIERDEKAH